MHIAEIGTVAKSLPLLRQRLINSSFKAILQIVAYFLQKRYDKSDTQIRLCEAASEEKEVAYVIEQATKAVNVGDCHLTR